MKKILISACLYGENVRYDGKNNSIMDHPFIQKLNQEGRLLPVCPEVLGGLGTPRVPVECDEQGRAMNKNGENKTENFQIGAESVAKTAIDEDIGVALMKARSPSCGKGKVYDGTFSKKLIKGNGFAVQRLEQQGVKVFSEEELDHLEYFLEKSDK